MDGPEYPKAAQAAPSTYLVAYEGSPMSEHMVHLACRIGNDTEATVLVLHAIVVPPQLPMTAALFEEDQRAEVVLSRAEAIASRYGVPGRFVVEHTRSVAEAIVETAREVDARIIFLGLRDRKRTINTLLLSSTVRYVLQHAPCQVQIGYLPAALADTVLERDWARIGPRP